MRIIAKASLKLEGIMLIDEAMPDYYVVSSDMEALVGWLVDVRKQIDSELVMLKWMTEKALQQDRENDAR